MSHNELLHGEAADVEQYLFTARNITKDHMLPALINAMRRIAALETEVERLRDEAADRSALAGLPTARRIGSAD